MSDDMKGFLGKLNTKHLNSDNECFNEKGIGRPHNPTSTLNVSSLSFL